MTSAFNLVTLLADELRAPQPERLALVVARVVEPELDPAWSLRRLDELAVTIGDQVLAATPGAARAAALLSALRETLGFHGNPEHYYAEENSLLPVVLERRTGLPILLSVVCMALGRRLGLRVEGLGMPGHFMAQIIEPEDVWVLDVYHGSLLHPADVGDYLAQLFSRPVPVNAASFTPVSAHALTLRMLNNLRVVYLERRDLARAARALQLMVVLEPERPDLWQEAALLAHETGDLPAAARALRRYFYLSGHVALVMPGNEKPTPPSGETARQLWALLQEIESAQGRWN